MDHFKVRHHDYSVCYDFVREATSCYDGQGDLVATTDALSSVDLIGSWIAVTCETVDTRALGLPSGPTSRLTSTVAVKVRYAHQGQAFGIAEQVALNYLILTDRSTELHCWVATEIRRVGSGD